VAPEAVKQQGWAKMSTLSLFFIQSHFIPQNRDQGLKTAWCLAQDTGHVDKPRDDREAAMSKTSMVLLRIAGSVVGLLVSGLVGGALGALVAIRFFQIPGHPDQSSGFFLVLVVLGFFVGGTMGAAGGATIAQKLLRHRSSFWRALLLAGVGMVVGIPCVISVFAIPIVSAVIVAGAVIGSGWKARPADDASSKAEPAPSFTRQGNDTHCKKCGSELIGQGGPCRKCDDVKTRPCSSCGRYILANDETCPYCGANLK